MFVPQALEHDEYDSVTKTGSWHMCMPTVTLSNVLAWTYLVRRRRLKYQQVWKLNTILSGYKTNSPSGVPIMFNKADTWYILGCIHIEVGLSLKLGQAYLWFGKCERKTNFRDGTIRQASTSPEKAMNTWHFLAPSSASPCFLRFPLWFENLQALERLRNDIIEDGI